MPLLYKGSLIKNAKSLRKNATPQENHLWYDFLRSYPVRFQRQKAIGDYIVDFYCYAAKLVVEIDGSQHFEEKGIEHDKVRTKAIEKDGLLVLRYSNRDINQSFHSVCEDIHNMVQERLLK